MSISRPVALANGNFGTLERRLGELQSRLRARVVRVSGGVSRLTHER
jgi:hypothetical protein